MRVELRIPGSGGPAEIASLHRWLLAEAPPAAGVGFAPSGDPEHQGVAIDVLTLMIGSGLSAAQLCFAIAQWRATRPGPPPVTITHRAPDGSITVFESTDPDALAAAARALDERP